MQCTFQAFGSTVPMPLTHDGRSPTEAPRTAFSADSITPYRQKCSISHSYSDLKSPAVSPAHYSAEKCRTVPERARACPPSPSLAVTRPSILGPTTKGPRPRPPRLFRHMLYVQYCTVLYSYEVHPARMLLERGSRLSGPAKGHGTRPVSRTVLPPSSVPRTLQLIRGQQTAKRPHAPPPCPSRLDSVLLLPLLPPPPHHGRPKRTGRRAQTVPWALRTCSG